MLLGSKMELRRLHGAVQLLVFQSFDLQRAAAAEFSGFRAHLSPELQLLSRYKMSSFRSTSLGEKLQLG